MSNASVVQNQSLADILQNRFQACNFITWDSRQQVFSYEIYEIFKNNFVYRTSLLWWVLLAVNSVNQWKHTLKIYAARKKWFTWTVLLRLVFLDTEYSSEVVQQLLAVPHFGKVAWKSQKQSSRELFCKKRCSWKILNRRCFPVNFAKFSRSPFFIEHFRWLLLKS